MLVRVQQQYRTSSTIRVLGAALSMYARRGESREPVEFVACEMDTGVLFGENTLSCVLSVARGVRFNASRLGFAVGPLALTLVPCPCLIFSGSYCNAVIDTPTRWRILEVGSQRTLG